MAGKDEKSANSSDAKGTSVEKVEKPPKQTFVGRVGQAVNAAAEVAGASALGKIAEAAGKAEASSDEQLAATDKGYFEAMAKLAEKAESKEERDQFREDFNKARADSHDNAKEKSKNRFAFFGQIATAVVVVVGGAAVAMKLIKQK